MGVGLLQLMPRSRSTETLNTTAAAPDSDSPRHDFRRGDLRPKSADELDMPDRPSLVDGSAGRQTTASHVRSEATAVRKPPPPPKPTFLRRTSIDEVVKKLHSGPSSPEPSTSRTLPISSTLTASTGARKPVKAPFPKPPRKKPQPETANVDNRKPVTTINENGPGVDVAKGSSTGSNKPAILKPKPKPKLSVVNIDGANTTSGVSNFGRDTRWTVTTACSEA